MLCIIGRTLRQRGPFVYDVPIVIILAFLNSGYGGALCVEILGRYGFRLAVSRVIFVADNLPCCAVIDYRLVYQIMAVIE